MQLDGVVLAIRVGRVGERNVADVEEARERHAAVRERGRRRACKGEWKEMKERSFGWTWGAGAGWLAGWLVAG